MELPTPVELTDAELDFVTGGKTQPALLDVGVVVKDINVNVNALTGPVINANA